MPLDQPLLSGEMPFLDHLEELRWRIIKSVVALAVAFGVAFYAAWIYISPIVDYLIKPILPLLPEHKLFYTNPMGAFTVIIQISGVLAIVLASPVIGYQVWSFLSPALTARERRVIVPVLSFGALLFLSGVALAVFVFVPITSQLMAAVKIQSLAPLITADEYFGFLFFLCLAFGAVFELPILVLILTALGLITPSTLSRFRRHAIVVSLVVCEIITPGDVIISTLILWIPVYGLYELSIIVSWFVYRARKKKEAQAQSIEAGATT